MPTPEARIRRARRTEGLAILVAAISLLAAFDGHNRANDAQNAADEAQATAIQVQVQAKQSRQVNCAQAESSILSATTRLPGDSDRQYVRRLAARRVLLRIVTDSKCPGEGFERRRRAAIRAIDRTLAGLGYSSIGEPAETSQPSTQTPPPSSGSNTGGTSLPPDGGGGGTEAPASPAPSPPPSSPAPAESPGLLDPVCVITKPLVPFC